MYLRNRRHRDPQIQTMWSLTKPVIMYVFCVLIIIIIIIILWQCVWCYHHDLVIAIVHPFWKSVYCCKGIWLTFFQTLCFMMLMLNCVEEYPAESSWLRWQWKRRIGIRPISTIEKIQNFFVPRAIYISLSVIVDLNTGNSAI